MPRGLKIVSNTDNILYDSAWIPGVDYNEEQIKIEIENTNKINIKIENQDQDEMHPDKIAGLAQEQNKESLIIENKNLIYDVISDVCVTSAVDVS